MTESDEYDNKLFDLLMEGEQLSHGQARALHKQVDLDDSLIDERVKLIGFLLHRQNRKGNFSERLIKHLGWFIQNAPKHKLHTHVVLWNQDAFNRCAKMWVKQLKMYSEDAVVLFNAGSFFRWQKPIRAKQIWKKAHVNNPTEIEITRSLMHVCADYTSTKKSLAEALEWAESCLILYTKQPLGSYFSIYLGMEMSQMGDSLLQAGATELCYRLADLLFRVHDLDLRRNIHRDTKHIARVIRGRAKILDKDRQGALEELRQMSVEGMPRSPNFHLAHELLQLGERHAVADYIAACRTNFQNFAQLRQKSLLDKPPDSPQLRRHYEEYIESCAYNAELCDRVIHELSSKRKKLVMLPHFR